MFRVIMMKVMNSDGVACDELSYIIASFSRCLGLNLSVWPIFAFGSFSINRNLHFSYRLM